MMATVVRVPREIFCVADHLYRDLEVAGDVLAGRFTQLGHTVAIDRPDWRAVGIHPDREWWIEWSTFYFGLDLAHAYALSGDDAYLRRWRDLVGSFIDEVPADFGPTDALARRLQNWVCAWQRFARVPSFPGFGDAFESRLTQTIATQSAYLQAHLAAEGTHRTLELHALLTIALALPETDPRGARADEAWRELQRNLLTDCRPDGVQREHSMHHHMTALRSWLGGRENARRFGLAIPPAYDDRLSRAVQFAMHCQRPDGTIPMLGDADDADYRDVLAQAADLLNRSDFAFVATNGRHGRRPVAICAEFADGGYCIQRGSWEMGTSQGSRPRHLIFDCGPLGDGGHGHYDALSIDAWASEPLVCDPGRFTYDEGGPNWRRWFKSTAAHNTVTVDRRDQTASRCGSPKTAPASARLISRFDGHGVNVVVGEARSAEYDAVHRRAVCFVDRDYWIVIDRLDGREPHHYDLRFNLGAAAWQRTTIEDRSITTPALHLLVAGEGALRLEDRWVAPLYGVKQPAPMASFAVAHRASTWFVSALLPRDVERGGDLSLRVDAGNDGLEITVRGAAAHRSDRLVAPFEGSRWTWSRGEADPEGGAC